MLLHTSAPSVDNSTTCTTPALNITGAKLIVAVTTSASGAVGESNLSDSPGNSWTGTLGPLFSAGGGQCAMFAKLNPTTSTSYTFTITTASGGHPTVCLIVVDGATATNASTGNSGTSITSLQPGSETPGSNGSLIVTGLFTGGIANSNAGLAIDSGFTPTDVIVPFNGCAAAYLIQGTAAAVNPTWSWTNSANGAAAIWVFTGTFTVGGCAVHSLPTLGVGCSLGNVAAAYAAHRLIKNPRISRRGFIKGWSE